MEERLSLRTLADLRTPLAITEGTYIFIQPKAEDLLCSPIGNLCDDAAQIEFHMPYSGIGYAIQDDSFFFKIAEMFDVYRLDEINQLEYLEDPDELPLQLGLMERFGHTRDRHSTNVCVIALTIAEVNKKWFDVHEGYKNALMVAALTHDVLTPAGGDTTKAIDRHGFDEDAQYYTVMTQERRKFLLHHGVDPELCIQTVLGKGVLGTILDIADKLAYVGHDLFAFAQRPYAWGKDTPSRKVFGAYVRKQLLPCNIWQHVRVNENTVWFEETESLTRFLSIRALLFRNLYTHPRARYREALLMFKTLSFLYEEKMLTRAQLLHMTDGDLRIFLRETVEWQSDKILPSKGHFTPKHQGFKTLKDAEEFRMKLCESGRLFVRIENLANVFKPAHHFNVKVEATVGQLRELLPKEASKLERIGKTIDPIRVSYLEGDEPHLGQQSEAFKVWCNKKAKGGNM